MHTLSGLLFSSSEAMTGGEKASLALSTLLLGMVVVFAVLLIIMVVIYIVGRIFQSVENKKQSAVKAPEPVDQPTQPVEATEAEDEGEIIAAITAAISVCMEEEQKSFRVVSFRKTSTKPAWNKK